MIITFKNALFLGIDLDQHCLNIENLRYILPEPPHLPPDVAAPPGALGTFGNWVGVTLTGRSGYAVPTKSHDTMPPTTCDLRGKRPGVSLFGAVTRSLVAPCPLTSLDLDSVCWKM